MYTWKISLEDLQVPLLLVCLKDHKNQFPQLIEHYN